MNSRSERFSYGLAEPEDRADLLALYESGDFQGGISILYTRRPDPLASLAREGHRVYLPVVRDSENGRIAGAGCCVVRKAFVSGTLRNVGYLTGLKVLPEYRKRIPHMARVYEYLREITRDEVALYYTTILEENGPARRLLEKKRPNMPEYRYAGDYTVYSFRTGGRRKGTAKIRQGPVSGWQEFSRTQAERFNLSCADLEAYGLGEDAVHVMEGPEGGILAGCTVWNQQSFKQHIPTAYSGVYRILRTLPLQWLGYPALPPVGRPMNYACITGLYVRDDDPQIAADFLQGLASCLESYDFLILGLHERHPLNTAMKAIRHIRYRSRLYTVNWPGQTQYLDGRPLQLEAGLL